METLEEKRIIVISHTLWTGPGHDLEEYLRKIKIKKLIFIGHPIYFRKGRPGPQFRYYEYGKLIIDKEYPYRPLPSVLQYFKDMVLTIAWVSLTRKKWDLIVALDCLNAFSGIILREMKFTKKIVYYTIDYTPMRFKNTFINNIYHWFDKVCLAKANKTWNVSPRIVEGRNKHRGLDPKSYPKQYTVPIGVWFDRIPRKPFESINRHTLVYMGGIVEKSGIQIVLEAIPEILDAIPDFKFLVIGSGEYEEVLKAKTENMGLGNVVNFTGYIENHEDVERMMSNCGVAIAPYNEALDDWTFYADPGKIKSYLASGLPIITTSLPYNAKDLDERECGIIIKYRKSEVVGAVIGLMTNIKKHRRFRDNSVNLGKIYNWKHIYLSALQDAFE